MTSGDMLCKALDLTRKALDFYHDAQGRCHGPLGRAVFSLLVEDKLRQARRLERIHAALSQGTAQDLVCVLDEEELAAQDLVFTDLAARHGKDTPACKPEPELLDMALDVEQACLGFLEAKLPETREAEVRAFLERAIQEERGHFVLLSDMRFYYEGGGG